MSGYDDDDHTFFAKGKFGGADLSTIFLRWKRLQFPIPTTFHPGQDVVDASIDQDRHLVKERPTHTYKYHQCTEGEKKTSILFSRGGGRDLGTEREIILLSNPKLCMVPSSDVTILDQI